MFSNAIILALVVAAVYGHEYHHHQHHHHPSSLRNALLQQGHAKEQHHYPYHNIRVQPEPSSSEEYKYPEAYQQYTQAHYHKGQESSEANEHVAPVYQHVDEQSQEYNVHQEAVKQKYQTVQYPVPAHHEFRIQVPSHEEQPQPQYQQESHEEVAYHHPVPHHEATLHESHDEPIDYYAYPKYQYEYKVEDPHTGDNKFHHEVRDGDSVKGAYGLHEADGSIRTVEYSSDKHHGFNAIVKHSAPGQHVHIESHHPN